MHLPSRLHALVLVTTACGTPVVKPDTFARDVLEREPLPARYLQRVGGGEIRVDLDPGWMGDVDPTANLVFARVRPGLDAGVGEERTCLVLACLPEQDRLVLLPLEARESALDVLADGARREQARARVASWNAGGAEPDALEISIRAAVRDRLLGSPLPAPKHVFAVAANFPSHLRHDLAIDLDGEARAALSSARPRVFLKHPPVEIEGYPRAPDLGIEGLRGPFDGLVYPERIAVPADDPKAEPLEVPLRLDYEIEIGAVFGRALTPEDARSATDQELLAAVAGYVLATDTKARNPQVVNRLRGLELDESPADASPYRPDDEDLARALGAWDAQTCVLWSYAASFGGFTAIGPFFVAAPAGGEFPSRALASARSYGAQSERGEPVPAGLEVGVPYLRQCSLATREPHADRMIWSIPDIVRSILAGDGILPWPQGSEPRIEVGDVVSLGTPGGVVVTSRSPAGLFFLRGLLFWWAPHDWHDAFFDPDAKLYLLNGDVVFYWAEGLGFQRQPVVKSEGAE